MVALHVKAGWPAENRRATEAATPDTRLPNIRIPRTARSQEAQGQRQSSHQDCSIACVSPVKAGENQSLTKAVCSPVPCGSNNSRYCQYARAASRDNAPVERLLAARYI